MQKSNPQLLISVAAAGRTLLSVIERLGEESNPDEFKDTVLAVVKSFTNLNHAPGPYSYHDCYLLAEIQEDIKAAARRRIIALKAAATRRARREASSATPSPAARESQAVLSGHRTAAFPGNRLKIDTRAGASADIPFPSP